MMVSKNSHTDTRILSPLDFHPIDITTVLAIAIFPPTAAYTAPTASTGERTNPYMATGTPPGMGTGTGVGVPRPGSEAQKTYTGASEPETTTTAAANAQELPIDTGITENDSGVGTGAGAQHFEEPETIDTSTGTNGDNEKDKGGKLPFKEQVKAYAKVRVPHSNFWSMEAWILIYGMGFVNID